VFLFLGIGLLSLSYAVEPVWYTFVAEISDRASLASAYSLVYASYMGIGLIAPMMAGMLASSFGFSSVYALSAFFGVVSLLVSAKMIAETKNREASAKVTIIKFMQSLKESVKPDKELRRFYLSMALDGISFGIGSRILYGMLTKSHGYDLYMISLLATSMTVSWAIVQIPLGKLIDRVGYKSSLIISQILSSVYIGALLLTQSFWMVLIFQALFGIAAALWAPAEQSWIASKVEPSKRGAYIGNYLAFKGFISFPAPFVGGVLFDSFGFFAPLFVNLVGAVIDILLLSILLRR
ncbi:MFS transporter, partial [Candidatus Bathyarchaeota archaeon]|nr:MFS transporter [Candidatus Bathyarchaeota archaeon]